MHDRPRIQLWRDWLLVAVVLVVLCVPLDLAADAAYRSDRTVLYWLLVAYSYPNGTPAATGTGLVLVAVALVGYWVSLRLLGRGGLRPLRVLATLVITALASVIAALTLLFGFLFTQAGPLISGVVILGGGLITVPLLLGLRALVGVRGTLRPPSPLVRPLVLIVGASLLVGLVAPVLLLIGESPIGYSHLASASDQDHRYYLALEQTPSDGSLVVLYRCDPYGVLCHQVDTLGAGTEQSANGWLRYDPATRTLTASVGDRPFITYQAGDLFTGP